MFYYSHMHFYAMTGRRIDGPWFSCYCYVWAHFSPSPWRMRISHLLHGETLMEFLRDMIGIIGSR